jgi:hypothetical protein
VFDHLTGSAYNSKALGMKRQVGPMAAKLELSSSASPSCAYGIIITSIVGNLVIAY